MGNAEKSAQLGMPYGTANHRLRKQVLFHLAKLCDLDGCYRCGEKIENIEEFSIEHKEPWFQVSNDLFWDISNIAFAHLICNVAAGRKTPRQPICWKCKDRPKAEGRQECVPCASTIKREWRAKAGRH